LIGPAQQTTPARFRELLVCLDGSERAASIVDPSATLAHDLGLGLWLVQVADPRVQVAPGSDASDTTESAMLQHAASRLDGSRLEVNWETLHGEHPARTIVEFAQARPSALIAMATRGRGAVGRLLFGSTTMSVVHHAPCPVVVGHPTGSEH
jgi:nucleotide-binding universal stress UspA family protein